MVIVVVAAAYIVERHTFGVDCTEGGPCLCPWVWVDVYGTGTDTGIGTGMVIVRIGRGR